MPEALGGYKYVSKISDEHTKWTKMCILKSKDGALHIFLSFVQSMAIPSGVRVKRLKADIGGEFIGNDFKDYCTQTGNCWSTPALTRRSKLACPSESEGRSRPWSGACLLTADYQRFSGGS